MHGYIINLSMFVFYLGEPIVPKYHAKRELGVMSGRVGLKRGLLKTRSIVFPDIENKA